MSVHSAASTALHLPMGMLAQLDKPLKIEVTVHTENPVLAKWLHTFASSSVTQSTISGIGA